MELLVPPSRLHRDRTPPASNLQVVERSEAAWVEPPLEVLAHRGLLAAPRAALVAKRCIDVLGSLVLLVLLLPVLLLIAVFIQVDSAGPVFFLQERVGERGRLFRMAKFRSMYRDADCVRVELAGENEVTGPVFKIRDDPRVTRVGRFLRRWSLDEVPQLWNVLVGQMSLVGPRPPLLQELAGYAPMDHARLLARPGITCIWQVSGRSDVPFETWMQMDRTYLRDWTLRLDLHLLVQTLGAVASRRGAY